MPTVFANGRSILHAKDGHTHVAAPPDVCKTPSPGGPVPIPYVNVAKDSDLAKGTKKIRIEGGSVALESSHLSTSSGDEPGTAGGGIVSSKTKGKLTWASSSPDVKFEGKAVVRFMDVTQHNGNTFNSAFQALGGTGFAYGDDGPCPICSKDTSSHRVLEMPDLSASVADLMAALDERLKAQRPIIAEHQRLKNERVVAEAKDKLEIDALAMQYTPLLARKEGLVKAAIKDGPALKAVMAELKPLDERLELLKAERKQRSDSFLRQMNAENAKLVGTNVLVDDDGTNTFTKGYMMGALVCKCPSNPKKLAACSGVATPGFKAAVADAGFTLVEAFATTERQQEHLSEMDRKSWHCAAPKLLQAGGAEGHKVMSISEKWYSPVMISTVTVEYARDGIRIEQIFESGETVPSCSACQALTPEMLCDNDKPCA